jgi:hypothetical protein
MGCVGDLGCLVDRCSNVLEKNKLKTDSGIALIANPKTHYRLITKKCGQLKAADGKKQGTAPVYHYLK